MRLLMVLLAPIRVSLTIGRMDDWTHIRQEVWRLYLLKRPNCPLIDEGLETLLSLAALGSPAASMRYIVGLKSSGVVRRE